jgi:hypothetical protein
MPTPTIVKVEYFEDETILRMSDGSARVHYRDNLDEIVREITQGAVLTWIDALFAQIDSEVGKS